MERLLDKHAVTKALSISATTLYSLIREGKIAKPRKIGTKSVWKASDLEAFMNSLENNGR